jgi:hypothetical protein
MIYPVFSFSWWGKSGLVVCQATEAVVAAVATVRVFYLCCPALRGLKNPSVKEGKADTPLTLRTINELLFRRPLSYGCLILYI